MNGALHDSNGKSDENQMHTGATWDACQSFTHTGAEKFDFYNKE